MVLLDYRKKDEWWNGKRGDPSPRVLTIIGPVCSPPERVPWYAPDGKDHSFSCDPKYGILEKSCTITKELQTSYVDYFKTKKLYEGLSIEEQNKLGTEIYELEKDWQKNHKWQHFMNSMTREEYDNKYVRMYFALERAHKEFKKTYKPEESSRNSGTDDRFEPSDKPLDWEKERMNVISEYGW